MKRQISKQAEHVKIRNTEAGEYEMICEHCGLKGIITPPVPMDLFLRIVTKFAKDHKHCEAPAPESPL